MALLITDEILERLFCNTCQKFLSVQPIKVYPNRKIKCGRCSEDGDAGVVSSFNLLAAQCVFKCVNRFDGCRNLLTYSEVHDHELECDGKSYVCPICPVSTTVSTFLMISHFKKEHKNMYLDIPSFFIDVNETLQMNKFFLYKQYDRLFIVIFRTDASIEYITISVMLFGDSEDARNISHRFTLCTPGTEFEVHSREKLCDVFDLSKVDGLDIEKFKIPKHHGKLYVTFRVNIANVDGMAKLPTKYYSLGTEKTDETDKMYFKSRFIYLDDDFRKTYSNFSIGLNLTSIVKNKDIEIVLSCSNCSLMVYCFCGDDNTGVYLKKIEQKYYLFCYLCSKDIKGSVIASSDMLGVGTLKKILFFCLWKCGQFFNITSLNEHEINCSLQPFQKCPVNCCKYKSKLFDIKQHMIKDHSKEFTEIFNENPNGVLCISLLIETSPIKQYVMVEHNFILIKVIWVEPQWAISIHKCTSSEKYDAAALLFYNDNTFLNNVKENQTVKICHIERLRIKCYFEMKGS